MTLQIGLVGDYSPEVTAHVAIPKALALAANDARAKVEVTWLPTESLAHNTTAFIFQWIVVCAGQSLRQYGWCAFGNTVCA